MTQVESAVVWAQTNTVRTNYARVDPRSFRPAPVNTRRIPADRLILSTNKLGQVTVVGTNFSSRAALPQMRGEIETTETNAIARYAPHKVAFAGNLRDAVPVELLTPERKRLKSRILGLSYFDTSSGRSVLITETKDCVGEIISETQVRYRDAFTDFRANVIYTYARDRFEQDVVLLENPPSPSDYGLNPDTTRLEVLTEFLDPPQPRQQTGIVILRQEPGQAPVQAVADHLDFGLMTIGSGQAFKAGGSGKTIPSAATWRQMEGRWFLIEAVDYPSVQPQLAQLQSAQVPRSMIEARAAQMASLDPQRRFLPTSKFQHAAASRPVRLAGVSSVYENGFVLDYVISNNIPTAGLKLWVKSDAGITIDTGVTTWADQSGNTNDFSQGEGGYQPEYVTNSINGRPVVSFDGDDDFMDSVLAIPTNAFPNVTLYTVERIREAPEEGDYRTVWGVDGTTGNYQRGRGIRGDDFEVQMGLWEDSELDTWHAGLSAATNTARIVGVTFTDTDTFIYINGTDYNAGWQNIGEGSEPLRIGAGYFGGQNCKVDFAEMLVYDRELLRPERAQLENYLNSRYNIFTNAPPAPVFSPVGGDYTSSISVTVTGSVAGVTYQYSTTGTNWANYSGPITVANNCTLLGRAIMSGCAASEVAVQCYNFTLITNQAIPTNGLKLWLRSDSDVVFNGSNVSGWRDQTANSNHVSQMTMMYQPIYVTNSINGKPAIRFDGADDWMDSLLKIPTNTFPSVTVYAVERIRSTPGGYRSVWGVDGTTGNWQRGRGFWYDDDHEREFVVQMGWRGSELEDNIWRPGLDAAVDSIRIVGLTYTPTNTFAFVNGTAYTEGGHAFSNSMEYFRIGAGYMGGQNCAVDLSEILVYDHLLSLTDRTNLEYSLSLKYVIDSDGDGLPDVWEHKYFGNLAQGASDDPDGDGFTNLQEYGNYTDPTDYYNGVLPCLDGVETGAYLGVVSNYLLVPLSAHVNGAGGLLTNAPVSFASSNSGAYFSTTTNGYWFTNVTVRSDTNGLATAWMSLPVNFNVTNYLTLSAGSGTNVIKAQLNASLFDFSGTGTLQTNTNSIPLGLALEPRTRWVDFPTIPHCAAGSSSTNSALILLDTNLFLEPTGLTNGFLSLTLHNADPAAYYQLLFTNDLGGGTAEWSLDEIVDPTSTTEFLFAAFYAGTNAKTFFRARSGSIVVGVSRGDQDAVEPNGAGPGRNATFTFEVTRGNDDVTIHYRTIGTASNGVDYTNLSGVVTILADEFTKEVEVHPLGDSLVEGVETVTLSIIQTNGYLIEPTMAAATILIKDSYTTVNIVSATNAVAIEPDGPPGAPGQTSSFSVTRLDERGFYSNALDVFYVPSGAASNGVDYTNLGGMVTIPAGSNSARVNINPKPDPLLEGFETVVLTLTTTTNYLIDSAYASATNTISDSSTTVSILSGTNAIETNSANASPGQTGSFVVHRSDSRGLYSNALAVSYLVSGGTALNGVDYATLGNVVTIPAGATDAVVEVQTLSDNVLEGDETVTLTLVNTNGAYLIDTNNLSATILILDNLATNPFVRIATLTTPIGIDYHAPSNSLIVSYNYANGRPYNFARIYTNGGTVFVTNWSGVSNVQEEVKLATAKATVAGFTNGEMYFGSGSNIGWISADGAQSNLVWCTLTNSVETNALLLRGSLYVDQTGSFSNQVIAVTSPSGAGPGNKGVWRVQRNGTNGVPELVANIYTSHLEGVITLTNDVTQWGPWAGKIITGDEDFPSGPVIYTIDPNGVVTTNDTTLLFPGGIYPEDFDIIPPSNHLYFGNSGSNAVFKLSATYLTNYVGDLLITDAGEVSPQGKLFIVHWDAATTNFVVRRIRSTGGFEHVTFAPIDLPPQ
jgi:hypothetical protein